jgi:hypothetical protein
MSHLTRLARGAAVAAALALQASLGGAQEAASPAAELALRPMPADSAARFQGAPPQAARDGAAPTLAGASVGVRSRSLAPDAAVAGEAAEAAYRRAFSQSQVLMIVGGAAFLTGAIIGDDAGTIVMIGGAAVGLYGLYLYLQEQ